MCACVLEGVAPRRLGEARGKCARATTRRGGRLMFERASLRYDLGGEPRSCDTFAQDCQHTLAPRHLYEGYPIGDGQSSTTPQRCHDRRYMCCPSSSAASISLSLEQRVCPPRKQRFASGVASFASARRLCTVRTPTQCTNTWGNHVIVCR